MKLIPRVGLMALSLLLCGRGQCQIPLTSPVDATLLEAGFRNPPNSARPHVWWHWMNGNVTKEGIKLDLEWMKRIGIAGLENIDVEMNTPRVVDKRLVYMTPEWKDAFRYATTLANQLDLEMGISGSPGWSESGGPWVQPSHAMKKMVWSETEVGGGKPFHGKLRPPSVTSGPFQNIPFVDFLSVLSGKLPWNPPEFYADAAVVAFRIPESELIGERVKPIVTSSAGDIDANRLNNGDFTDFVRLPVAQLGHQAWIQFEYPSPHSIKALTLSMGGIPNPFFGPPPGPELMVSDDGKNFRTLISMHGADGLPHTVSFPAITGRFFRMTFATAPQQPPPFDFESAGFKVPSPQVTHDIGELVLYTGPRISHFEEKAGFAMGPDLYAFATPPASDAEVIHKSDVIDLTSQMHADGSLEWTPPQGSWIILRVGYSLTGKQNSPAQREATGLEVDKLNGAYVREYMQTYLDNYQSAVGDLIGQHGLRYLGNDSWEAGAQNWTDQLPKEFEKQNAYSLIPWLPALTGRIVESAEDSDRFLWDFRQTLGNLLAENHYDLIESMLKERGMTHYAESHESGRAFIGDGMAAKRRADVPMGAMWVFAPGDQNLPGYNADIHESASVAHIYGQNLVAAESLTTATHPWAWSPELLKPTLDKEFALGVNRIVIHTSVHQPLLNKSPGLGLGPVGQWFTRNETWAESARPWIDYIARNSFMLQQGHFVADIAYFYGEDTNITALFASKAPAIPEGYNFDYVNADALLHQLTFESGALSTPSGMTYQLLVLDPNTRQMSLPVLRRIRDLVTAGAIVVGPKPVDTPSLADDESEFTHIANQLWSSDVTSVGKGKVYATDDLNPVLQKVAIPPDFRCEKTSPEGQALFVHRKLPSSDVYFVDSRSDRPETIQASFRISGVEPELWHADTGMIEPASFHVQDGRTTVPLSLDPFGTVFVVFRKTTSTTARTLPASGNSIVSTVEGPWSIAFEPARDTPGKSIFTTLTPWTDSPDPNVKYYSGTGVYSASFNVPTSSFSSGAHFLIDLGDVKDLAEVSINDQPLGVFWKGPFRADATAALKPGTNKLVIRVTNLWPNRMIGDRQPYATKPFTFADPKFYKADSPLLPSGLLGPVKVIRSTVSP